MENLLVLLKQAKDSNVEHISVLIRLTKILLILFCFPTRNVHHSAYACLDT